jgi:hypothetical protein
MLDQIIAARGRPPYDRLMLNTGRQIAAALALLKKPAAELADKADVSIATLRRIIATEDMATGRIGGGSVHRVERTLIEWGVVFLSDGEQSANGEGVRLRRRS